ncbi:putative membrane protein [Methanococcus voltae PS]|uniref:Membrane protein n=1 Tax=Methanococcus voltae PS TaxID=523842 RepID=A0ABT2EYJ6_METVO|nr:hypothetical protein [Methanococcus voltae]MCS3921985.1 putative membrane protein [Methanococcus voltae PS]
MQQILLTNMKNVKANLKMFANVITGVSRGEISIRSLASIVGGIFISIIMTLVVLGYLLEPLTDALNGTALAPHADKIIAMIGIVFGLLVLMPLLLLIDQMRAYF